MSQIKVAMKTNRTFGVEIETFGASAPKVVHSMAKRGLACSAQQYNHDTCPTWKIVPDASIADDSGRTRTGFELVSPVLSGEEGMAQLKKAIESLRVNDAQANRSCGLHVHVYIGDLEIERVKSLVKQLVRDEVLLDLFLAPNRLTNYYAQSNLKTGGPIDTKEHHDETYGRMFDRIDQATTVDQVLAAIQPRGRYYKINLCAYARQGTIEFRAKECTLEYDEIMAWVKMVVELTQWLSRRVSVQRAANTYGPIKRIARRMLAKCSPDVQAYYGAKLDAMGRTREAH